MHKKETRAERFKRVARTRIRRTLRELELLGNLGNRNHYEYTQEDVDKMFNNLEAQLKEARSRFTFKRSKHFEF